MRPHRTALGALLIMLPVAASAAPLAPEQCAQLSAELTSLDNAGIKALLEKGPSATKATLTREQRDKVRTYLDKLGHVRFRCPNETPLVTLKSEPPEDPAEAGSATAPIEAGSAGITLPPGVAAAVIAPPAAKKPPSTKAAAPTPKAAAPTGPPANAEGQAASKAAKATKPASASKPEPKPATPTQTPAKSAEAPPPKAKPQPKPKVDDAFRPPQPVPQ